MPKSKKTFLAPAKGLKTRLFSTGKCSHRGVMTTRASVLLMVTAVTVLFFVEASRMGLGAVPLSSMWGRAVWTLGGMALGGMLFPGVLRFLRLREAGYSRERHGPAIAAMALVSLAISALFAFGNEITRYFTPNPDFSHIALFARGLFVALALLLFFGAIPGRMQGRCLGVIFAVVEVLRFFLVPVFSAALAQPDARELEALLRQLQNSRLVLAALVVLLGLASVLLWYRSAKAATHPAAEEKAAVPSYRLAFSPLAVLGMAALCFTLNGGLNGILEYVMRFFPVPACLHLILGVVFVLAGVWVDKGGCKAMRVLVISSSCCFLLLPALLVTSPDGAAYNLVRYSGMISLPVFSFCMVLLAGRGPFEGRFPGLMCVSVHIMFFASYYGFALDAGDFQDEVFLLGMALPVSIVILLFFSLARHLGEPARDPADLENSSPEPGNERSFSDGETLEGFVCDYNISPRKKELLVLLLEGASTKRIAAAMGIAEYTVRLHIHEILRKVDLPNRKCLIKFIRRSNIPKG